MSFETAKSVIDSELSRIDKDIPIDIEFIGGEPFLPKSFELIKEVVRYIDATYPERHIMFVATTNGTCVHGDVQDFLMDNAKRFIVSLSLDGSKISNDINRPTCNGLSSYDMIDIPFFQKLPNKVTAKMTVSPDTLPTMAEDIEFIENLGFICNATFATGIEWSETYNIDVLVSQLNKLVEKYSVFHTLPLPKIIQVELTRIFDRPKASFKYCGAGKNSKAFDCKGNCYPCQGFAPVTLGEKAEEFINCTFEDFRINEDDPCFNCKLRGSICSTCFSENYGVTGDIHKQPPQFCIINRLTALASAQIQFNRLLKKTESTELSFNDQQTLKAIELIQKACTDENFKFLWDIQKR